MVALMNATKGASLGAHLGAPGRATPLDQSSRAAVYPCALEGVKPDETRSSLDKGAAKNVVLDPHILVPPSHSGVFRRRPRASSSAAQSPVSRIASIRLSGTAEATARPGRLRTQRDIDRVVDRR